MSNVVLTGFMGTGKSTVGRALASALDFEFVDTDAIIVERHGSISQIFERGGEGAFRQLERDTAVELAGRTRCVIATGGRFMLDEHNATVLAPSSDVFALIAEPEEIARRVLKDGIATRPLLADAPDPLQRIREMVEQRRAGYAKFATVKTDGRAADEIVREIVARRRTQSNESEGSMVPALVVTAAVAAAAAITWALVRRQR
jgi:shikimate kinase